MIAGAVIARVIVGLIVTNIVEDVTKKKDNGATKIV